MKLKKILGLNGVSKDGHIIGCIFIISILLPHTGLLYFVNPMLLIYLIMKYSNEKNRVSFVTQFAIATIIILSIVWTMLSGIEIPMKSLVRSLYILMIVMFFPFTGDSKIPSFYVYFVVITILLSQVAYILNIGPVLHLIDAFYPADQSDYYNSEEFLVGRASEADSMADLQVIRFGGLFHNPNQCMKYMSLCAITYVVGNFKSSIKKFIPFIFLIILSAFLAGSRTGFAIIVLTFIVAFALRYGQKNISTTIFIISIGGIAFFLLGSILSDDFRLFRIFNGNEGEDSIGIKYRHLVYYIGQIDNLRAYLVGNSSLENIKSLYNTPFTQFDSEWGNAVYFFGFIFIGLYGYFLFKIVSQLKGVYIVGAFMLLWIISSTVLFSYRTSFAFFLVLSICYSSSLKLNSKSARR